MVTVVVDGARLEYAWHGPKPSDAPTLVFLHEGLGSAAMWRDVPRELAARTGWGALVYSRRGYGGSDAAALPRPLRYMHDEATVTLPAVLDALGVRDFVLVGHSDGASIAIVYAGTRRTQRAPRLRGLALLAPHVFCEDVSVASIRVARQEYERGDLRAKLERWHGANVDGAFFGWNDAWLAPEFRAWNLEEYLPRIGVPVLLVQGEDDRYGTLRQLDAIEAGIRGAPRSASIERLVLPSCGHAPHKDQPEATLAAIATFVRSVSAPAS
jgi:pimeloyl-ACP methyl ester carboxylesterase